MTEQARYRLTLRSEPSSVPSPVRLRRLLKYLLRGFGFRCESVSELEAEGPQQIIGEPKNDQLE